MKRKIYKVIAEARFEYSVEASYKDEAICLALRTFEDEVGPCCPRCPSPVDVLTWTAYEDPSSKEGDTRGS